MQWSDNFDENALFSGFMWGMVIGGTAAFFAGPRIRVKALLERGAKTSEEADKSLQAIKDKVTSDPLQESIDEGKQAARQRRAALRRQS